MTSTCRLAHFLKGGSAVLGMLRLKTIFEYIQNRSAATRDLTDAEMVSSELQTILPLLNTEYQATLKFLSTNVYAGSGVEFRN